MRIMALDLGARTGFAFGEAGSVPKSGAVVLKDPSEPRSVALSNMIAWLHARWTADRPDRVVIERPINLQGFANLGNGEGTIRMAYGLAGIVEAMTGRFGLPEPTEAHDATVRKHFIGRGRMGDRASMKRAVVRRCHVLGYLPKHIDDDDRADALAIFDWASAHLARKPPQSLHLFNEATP